MEPRRMRRETRILDEYLAAAARAGDRDALGRLAASWEKRLIRHAWRLTGDPELARDVAQEAWLDIVRSVRRLDDAAAFPALAFRIVTRRAADAVRRARRSRANVAAFAAEPAQTFSDVEDVEARASTPSVARALAILPADQRAAVALFYLEDLSVAEIAAALGVPAGTVKTRLMAAREKLRLALGVDEGD
jgi:RNA polymerase sigma-70 factor (ECF subfamily)